MAKHSTKQLRNVGLVSHSGAGKTTMAEAMMHLAGATNRRGSVDDRNSILDFEAEERERQVSISTSIAPFEWKDSKINILDTPGYFDFVGEVKAALRASDAALVVIEAVSGVEVGTELVWGYANDYGLPKAVFVNKMERENADFMKVLSELREAFAESTVPLYLPIGKEKEFTGLVDLLGERALLFDESGQMTEGEIPGDMTDMVEEYREELLDAVAERDDELLMMYLEGEELDLDRLRSVLREAVCEGEIVPVLCGSGLTGVGMLTLMDFFVDNCPSPADAPPAHGNNPSGEDEVSRRASEDDPFSALVFKTLADPYVGKMTLFRVISGKVSSDMSALNSSKDDTESLGQLMILRGNQQESVDGAVAGDLVAVAKLQHTVTGDTLCAESDPVVFAPIAFPKPIYSVAVEPEARGDEDKIGSGLSRLSEEDPTFQVERNPETNEHILSGMGDVHVAVIAERLKRKFGVGVKTAAPKIAYRETVKETATARYRHKKQSGGRGQFGEVDIRVEPLESGEFEFADEIFGGSVPNQFIPAVEKGVRESMGEGPIAGYPVIGVKVALYDGGYHPVDSSEMAFKTAAAMAFKQAFMSAEPILLEPIYDVEVRVPDSYMGDVIGDLNRKRGKITGMVPEGRMQVIRAKAPGAEMVRYAIDLRSITQGRGTYSMEFSSYEPVPANIQEKIAEAANAEEE